MIKTITKVGNSQGIIFDAALMDLARLKPGDQMNVEVHAGGAITLTPIKQAVDADEAGKRARELVKRNDKLFKRLA
jgi:antitoxin component of MazEF toxin-antitoxin module